MLKKFIQAEKYRDILSILLFAITAAVFFISGSTNSFQITTNFLANNNFASPDTTLFTPAIRVLFTIEYRYFAVALLIILVVKLVYRIYGKKKLHSRLDLMADSFSYSIFVVFISLLSGLQDISTLVFVLASSFIGVYLMLANAGKDEDNKVPYIKPIATILVCVSWLLLVIYSLGTLAYGDIRATWYVYLLDFIALTYLLFLVFKDKKFKFSKKLKTENRKLIKYGINILLKVIFLIVLAIGIH
jgi:hypothetical protein